MRLVFLLILLLPLSLSAQEDFRSSSSVAKTREQIRRLPDGNIWWSVTGEDMGWYARNLQRFNPTATVYRDGPVRPLETELMPEIAAFEVETPEGTMSFVDFLDSDMTRVFGVLILHHGKVVFEHYPRMEPYEKPTWWSVSKITISAMVSILEDRGLVDIEQPIERYIPEMATSSYAGTRVRSLLDMASGIDCPEEYYDRSSCYNRVMQSMGETWFDQTSPDNMYGTLAAIQAPRIAEQGTVFDYGSVNTDILGWLVEKVTGMPFSDAFSRDIWTRIGAQNDAAFLAPRYGVPHFDGGFLARMRDMARFGLLYTPSYTVVSNQRIISLRHVNAVLNDGNPELLRNANSEEWNTWARDHIRHNAWQWDLVYKNGDMFKGGWAGQGLLVNPDRDVVAVYAGYFKDSEGSEEAVFPRLQAVLDGVIYKQYAKASE